MSPSNTTAARVDDATPSIGIALADNARQQPSSLPYEERVRLRKEKGTSDADAVEGAPAPADATDGDAEKANENPTSTSTSTPSSTLTNGSNSGATSVSGNMSVVDAGSGVKGNMSGGDAPAPGDDYAHVVTHHNNQPPPRLPPQGPAGTYQYGGRGPSPSYGPQPPLPPSYEYGGRPNYPPPSYGDHGGGHYASLNRGGQPPSYRPPPLHNAHHPHFPPTGSHHFHPQHPYGGPPLPPHSSSYGGAPPHGQQQQQPPPPTIPAPSNQHVGEEYAKRHSPVTRQQQQQQQQQNKKQEGDEEEKKMETEDMQESSSKGALNTNVKEEEEESAVAARTKTNTEDPTEKSASATSPSGNVGAADANTGILRNSRTSVIADLAADDSHPEADDVEPLPPKALFHSSVDVSGITGNNKPDKSPSGIMKDTSIVPGSTGLVKKERHVGFEADSKLPPANSGAPSLPPPHHHSYYEHVHHHGYGRPSYPPAAYSSSTYPHSGAYHHHHHHQPPHSYGHPAGMGHGMGIDPHHPSPPPPVHSPYYAEYRPHTTGEYRPAASLRRNDEEKPLEQQKQQQHGREAVAPDTANEGEKERTSSLASSGKEDSSAKNVDVQKEGADAAGDATETPKQHEQPPQMHPNGRGISPYAAYDAYAPYGRYHPPPSGMRIGGGPGNRHYDHSPLDSNPDRQKPRAESYEIDPRDPRAVAGVATTPHQWDGPRHHSSLDSGSGNGHGHSGPPVTPHGYFSHHPQEPPYDVRGGMDRLVATPASGGFVSSVRGRQYDYLEQPGGDDPYRHLGRYATPSAHGFNEYPPLSEIKHDGPHPSPMALDKDTFFRASPQQPGRPSASPISRTDPSGRLSYPPTTPHFDARYQEENYTPLRYDRAHPLPSAGKGTESLFPSPTQRGTFNGGITYATPLVRRKGGEADDKDGNRLDSPSRVAADAAAAAAAHQHFYHQYDGPPSPAADFPPPHPVHGYTPNFAPLSTNASGHPTEQLPTVAGTAPAKPAATTKKRKKAADGTKKASKSKDDRRQKMYSDYTGVTYNKTHAKYQACITHYRKQHYLGRYKLAVDAARAYDESAKLLKGSGWKINFGTIDDYELAKRKELEHLMEKERADEESVAESANGGRKKKKKATARDLAHIAVKIQVPSSVFKVVAEANGQAAARKAQKIIAEVNQATIERVRMQKENSPTTSLPPSRRTELPSKTPSNTVGRASMEVTPSPFALGINGQADPSAIVAFTPSNNKTSTDQGGADIAATGNDYTPNSELRPKKIVKEAGAMPTATHGPKSGRIITPQQSQKPGEDEAASALCTLSAMKR